MPDWAELLAAAPQPTVVVAETYLREWGTASRPVLLTCDDGRDYVVKGAQGGKQPVNDQIIARLGSSRGCAPVGAPVLVDLPQELIAGEPSLAHMPAGLAHGTRFLPNCTERAAWEHAQTAENRQRFAALALLYGWVQGGDLQVIYENQVPYIVHSVDHGHFFPGGPEWSTETLRAAPAPTPNQDVMNAAGLTVGDLDGALFARISDAEIAAAVAAPPATWSISSEERLAVVDYLATRRDLLFAPWRTEGGPE